MIEIEEFLVEPIFTYLVDFLRNNVDIEFGLFSKEKVVVVDEFFQS